MPFVNSTDKTEITSSDERVAIFIDAFNINAFLVVA